MGNFTSKLPSSRTRQLLKNMFACGVSKGKIKTNYVLRGHRDMDNYTSCPGERFYQEIRTWPHYWCSIKKTLIKKKILFIITLTSSIVLVHFSHIYEPHTVLGAELYLDLNILKFINQANCFKKYKRYTSSKAWIYMFYTIMNNIYSTIQYTMYNNYNVLICTWNVFILKKYNKKFYIDTSW